MPAACIPFDGLSHACHHPPYLVPATFSALHVSVLLVEMPVRKSNMVSLCTCHACVFMIVTSLANLEGKSYSLACVTTSQCALWCCGLAACVVMSSCLVVYIVTCLLHCPPPISFLDYHHPCPAHLLTMTSKYAWMERYKKLDDDAHQAIVQTVADLEDFSPLSVTVQYWHKTMKAPFEQFVEMEHGIPAELLWQLCNIGGMLRLGMVIGN